MGERPEGSGCELKYLIPNTILTNTMSLRKITRDDETMGKNLIPNTRLTHTLIVAGRPGGPRM